MIGTLVGIYLCHNFDCKKIKAQPISCKVETRLDENGKFGSVIGQATINGESFDMQWFKTGSEDGLHGQTGMHTLSLFYRSGRLKSAYLHHYTNRQDYLRYECRY
jgi:hypothetical protein